MIARIALSVVVFKLAFSLPANPDANRPALVASNKPSNGRDRSPRSDEEPSPDLTAVVLVAGLKTQDLHSKLSPRIEAGLRCVREYLRSPDAGAPEDRETFLLSFALMALSEANDQRQHDDLINQAVQRLRAAQWSPARECLAGDPSFGGTGFKPDAPPDLYHTSLAIEALHEAGVPSDDAYMQRALRFVIRCQLDSGDPPASEHGDSSGGFSILPPRPNASPEDALQPCGSLTCAGVKSLIHCGVSKDDARIQAAMRWLSSNYTVEANPGMLNPRCRLYDYYRSFATVMTLLNVEVIVDADAVEHHWRAELADALHAQQQRDGRWENRAEANSPRESHPLLTTSYAMLTLHEVLNASTVR